MFYVVGKKVYLAEMDATLGIYREIDLIRDTEGAVRLVALDTGLKSKPKRRQLCTAREVVAQLGALARPAEALTPPTTPVE